MLIFSKRPLATACASAMAISVLSFILPFYGKLFCLVLLGTLLLVCLFYQRKNRKDQTVRITACLSLAFMVLAVTQSIIHFHFANRIVQDITENEEECAVTCLVLEEGNAGGGYAYYTVKVTEVDGIRTNFRASLECGYTATFHCGDIISLTGQAQPLDTYYDAENRLYAIADGIRLGLICENPASASIIGSRNMPIRLFWARCRENLAMRLLRLTGKQNGELATALFLGDRDKLDPSISTYFHRAGVSHLLALSGTHVTLLLTMLTTLTTALHIPKKGSLLLLSVFILCYLALTGFRISAIRAVGMILLFYLSEFMGTRNDPLTTLCMVGMIMLTVSPATVADGGFWMSFSAVFGLVTLFPPINEWLKSRRISRKICMIWPAIASSMVAVISVSMLSWLFGSELSPLGIFATVLFTPLLILILLFIPLTLLLDILPMMSAMPLAVPLATLLKWMIRGTDLIAHLPHLSLSLQLPFAGPVLILMTVCLFVMLILPLRRKIWLCLPPLLAIISLVTCFGIWNHITYAKQVQASYVTRSSGSALILTEYGNTTIIDTSSGSYAMLHDAERAARMMSATEIDSLVLTHYHRALVYSTERLAKRQMVHCVYLPLPQTESEYYILTAMRDRLTPLGTQIRCYEEKDVLRLLPHVTYIRANATYLSRSTQPIITYLVQTEHEVLTFTTPAVQESAYASAFHQLMTWTDILILGADGPTIKMPLKLPSPAGKTPHLLLTDSIDLLPYIDIAPSSPLSQSTHITNITRYAFSIAK